MNSQKNKKICLKDFVPEKAMSEKNKKNFPLNIIDADYYLTLFYETDLHNWKGLVGKKRYSLVIPKNVSRSKETFVVLGLLQAEMGKQQDGKIVFCNHEYQLINKVLKWFEKELEFSKNEWKWYIKVNINEPLETNYKQKIENKVINHWIKRTGLKIEQSYPKKVSYIKNTENKILKSYDYGTLIIEKAHNLLSQIIKRFVKTSFYNITQYDNYEIRQFMRAIIAGEANVEVHTKQKRFRVFITAIDPAERKLFQLALEKLGIKSIQNGDFKSIIVSRKENNLKLLEQKLMTLSPEKYNKFLRMMKLYGEFDGLNSWKKNLQKPWNKIPQDVINKVIQLHNQNPEFPAWKIAEQLDISEIKVQRIRKEYALGNQKTKLSEEFRRNIAKFAKDNPNLKQHHISAHFKVHESCIRRAIIKYSKTV